MPKNHLKDVIDVKNLKKSYGNHVVLNEISFQIQQGEIFALLGINGAGKTTTLECIEGFKKADSGEVKINGTRGIQFQSSSLPAYIKPKEVLMLFVKWNHIEFNHDLIQSLGILEFKNKTYSQLSTGQKRRLHLALALIKNPEIIFLDEPTAGLDVEGRISLHEQIKSLKRQGKTVVLTSHDMTEVEALCDRIAILNNGKIVFCGTATQLTEEIGRKYLIQIITEQGSQVVEADNIEDELYLLLQRLKEKDIKVLDIQVNRGTLEQHFMELAKREQ